MKKLARLFELKVGDKRFLAGLGVMSLLTLAFLAGRILATHTSHFYFVGENLILAWLPLILVALLRINLKHRRWLSWQNLCLTGLWFIFLPNTWYVLTDFVHLAPTDEIDILFDITMIGALAITGFALGFTSLYLMHRQLLKRLRPIFSSLLIGLVLFLSSFAIYLGRDLRWSTIDIIRNPSGIILNITDRIINPLSYIHSAKITGIFFFLLSGIYWSICIMRPPAKISRLIS